MPAMKNNFKQRFLSSAYSAALALLLCSAAAVRAGEPAYLAASHADVTIFLAPPPVPGSTEQAADLAETVAVHQAFAGDAKDEEAGWSKKKLLHAMLAHSTNAAAYQAGTLPKAEVFFKRISDETGNVVDTAKDFWKRPRPYTVKPDLLAGKVESSFGYPSGHSTGGMVTALVLAELYPDRAAEILAIGREIGWHRVELGKHYPTDVVAGRVLAMTIVREMKTSPEFQRDFAAVKKEIAAAK
jgi:acid phosphatase (class A)